MREKKWGFNRSKNVFDLNQKREIIYIWVYSIYTNSRIIWKQGQEVLLFQERFNELYYKQKGYQRKSLFLETKVTFHDLEVIFN